MELNATIEALGRAFDEFKKTNDQQLAELKKAGVTEPTLDAKLAKINAEIARLDELKSQLDKVETKLNRPNGGGAVSEKDQLKADHQKAFGGFMRKGHEIGLREMEQKALNIGTSADGGYAVPEQIDRTIQELLIDISPIRSIANVVTVGTSDYKRLVNIHGTASGWVGETAARTATASPQLAEVIPPMGEIYAYPEATQQSLDDIFFNAEEWLSSEVATEFAKAEGSAFVSGNGTNKPKGFLAYATAATADGARAFGTIEHIATGVSGDFAASNKGDILIQLIYKLKAGHRNGARFAMNKGLLSEVRRFKDGDGQYLWAPGLAAGQPSTLLGYPVLEAEDMPAKAADSLSIAFGNFRAGYVIVDRMGTRVLRDPFTNKPYVGFYTTKRVGGGLVDSEAVKVIKFAV